MKASKSFLYSLTIAALLTFSMILLSQMEWYSLQTLELKTYDVRQRMRQKKPLSPVVIVAIDDQSVQKLGRWPWPRAYLAELIDTLKEGKPSLIAASILFTEPDRNSGLDEVRAIRKQAEEGGRVDARMSSLLAALAQAERKLDNDAFLADAVSRSKNVLLPMYFTPGEQQQTAAIPEQLKRNALALPLQSPFPTAIELSLPIKPFLDGAVAVGHLNLFADDDGTLRRESLFVGFGGYLFPSLALQTALTYLNKPLSEVVVGPDSVAFGATSVPVDQKGRMLVDFRGKFNTFPYFSFVDVISGRIPPETFQNKIVLIGTVATGIAGFEVTPAQPVFPSVEITANVIDSLLSRTFISRPAWSRYAEIILMFSIGAFLALVLPRLNAGLSALISVAVLAAWNGFAVWLFVSQGEWLGMISPSLLLIVGYIMIVSLRFMVTEKHKELVESDSIETNKMLGLSFQGQGLLDLAFEKFRKCPIDGDTVRDLLYNLGLDFERKRMFNKAGAVYEHILSAGDYRDVRERMATMKSAGETMIFGTAGARKENTVLLEGGGAAGPTIGRFEIQKELGRGAMGTVFLGRDPKINRMVAIKTIRFDEIDPEQSSEIKQRFFREAEAAGALNHPNIVTIYDVGEDYDLAYVAMELLDGCDLSSFTKAENRLPFDEVLKIIAAVADGLAFASERGIVHRDIKPANIMRLNNGDIKIADFGIARITASSTTKTGMVLGTPSYMSPEQVAGQKVDGRADLFSLGVVMYELLSCRKPFTGDSLTSIMYSIANRPPLLLTRIDPQIPECCAYIAHKLMIKDVSKRYQSGREVAAHVRMCLEKLKEPLSGER